MHPEWQQKVQIRMFGDEWFVISMDRDGLIQDVMGPYEDRDDAVSAILLADPDITWC